MATHWQTYRGGPTKAPVEVVNISINDKHVITFNRRAVKLLGEPEAAVMLFDGKNSIIGLTPSNRRNPEAFPLLRKNSHNWIINAAPFCRHFNISVERTERFVDPELDDEAILRLDLRRTVNVSLKKGRSQKATG